jgi:sugar lactone lactonase YvrE
MPSFGRRLILSRRHLVLAAVVLAVAYQGMAAAAPAIIDTVAGTGLAGFSGDGGPATAARLNQPRLVAADAIGNLYIADTGNNRIRKLDTGGRITTIGGTGAGGYSGDGGPAVLARFRTPHGVALDAAGDVYVADSANQRVRKIDAAGIVTTVAGTGTAGYNGDGIAATAAKLRYPKGVEVGSDDTLYIADNNNNRVRSVDPAGKIHTFAGTGAAGFSGDGGPATSARLNQPRNLAFGPDGALDIADQVNHRIRRVAPDGTITTVAGDGSTTASGDDGLAVDAGLGLPDDVAVDAAGNVYVADETANAVRRVDAGGVITRFAGTGAAGFTGDGGPPDKAQLNAPHGVTFDPATATILIADTGNNLIRRVAG